jgi:large repetitive protein
MLVASLTFFVLPARAFAAGTAVIPNSAFTNFTDVQMQPTDDGSWPSDYNPQVFPFGFNINFFGTEEPGAYINNNGDLTFTGPLSEYSPFGLPGATTPIIAPFFADVETEAGSVVNIGTGTFDGFPVFVANWPGVQCYSEFSDNVLDNFQVILIDRADLGTGVNGDDFQIEFNYDSIQWDAGQASGGDGNCTNAPDSDAAAVGYSDGSQTVGHYYQLPGSQSNGALMDSNTTTGLIYNDLNSDDATSVPPSGSPVPGRYIFNVDNGQPISPTTLVTSLAGGGTTGTSLTVPPNTSVTDSATLPGANTATAGGTVTYGVYSDNACTTLVQDAGTVTVVNGAVPDSNPVSLAALGTFYWNAAYSGDSLDDPSTNACSESETVAVPPASVATVVNDATRVAPWDGTEVAGATADDTATVSGTGTPSGTVTYGLFTNGTCSGGAATTHVVTMSAGLVPNSPTTAALAAGSYSFLATYSGDANNALTIGACEPFSVVKTSASPGSVVDNAALNAAWNGNEATGASAYDTSSVTAVGGFVPTGTVLYSFFTNGTCAASASTTDSVTISGGVVPHSTATGALGAGAYSFSAGYSGDGNYLAASSACEPFSVAPTSSGVGTVVDDASTHAAWDGSETIGATADDTATVTRVGGFVPAGTVTYTLFPSATCTGSPIAASTKTLVGGLVPNSTTTAALAQGAYSFRGAYSGDVNYLPATGSCEPFTVTQSASSLGTVVDDAGTNTAWAGTETVGATAYDTATVTPVSGFAPAGTVTYDFFTNGTCSSSPSSVQTVTLSGGAVPNSAATAALGAGLDGFKASYSGDANYHASTATCVAFTFFEVPAITSATAALFTTNDAGTFTVTTTGYPTAASMHIDDGGAVLPAGVTFVDNGDGTATLAGTPGALTFGMYPISITASNGITPAAVQTFTLTVGQPPSITTVSAITFKAGTFGSFEIDANGFPGIGTLTLSDGGATLPAGMTFVDNGDDTATLSGSASAGTGGTYTFTITASNGVAPDATQSFTLTIDEAPTVTSADNTTFAVGAASTFTVTMAGFPAGNAASFSDGGGNLPSGVSFVDNGNGTATLAGTPAPGTVGTYPLTLTVSNGIAPSGTQSFTLTVANATTTTALSSPTNPSLVGQSVTLVAAVAVVAPGTGSPTGTVSFSDGGSPMTACTSQPVTSGTATCVTSFATAATHPLTASYNGDGSFGSSTSAAVSQVVTAAATSVASVSSANPSVTGQTVTYTATVSRSAPATGDAGGTVAFTDNGTPITGCAAVIVDAGVATCTVTYLAPGAHSVVATYSGDDGDQTSVAAPLAEQVELDSTVTTVTSSPNPSTVGDVVTITVTVKAALPGSGNPTGTVTIFVDGRSVATVALDSNVDSRAVFTMSDLVAGTHAITAIFNGDSSYTASSAGASADSQDVVLAVTVPATGGGTGGWGVFLAMMLIINGTILIAWTRRRRRL